jgi:trans-2-enoyl-CoA reductase
VIQGVYPSKPVVRRDIGPETLSIMGNEGCAIVEGFEEDGTVENELKIGDMGPSIPPFRSVDHGY